MTWWSQRGGALWQCGRGWGHTKWCRRCLQAKNLPGLQNLEISKENKQKKKKKKLSMSGQVRDGMDSCYDTRLLTQFLFIISVLLLLGHMTGMLTNF